MISSRDALLTEFFNTLVTAAFPSDSRANIDKRRRFFQYVGRISNIAGAAAGVIPGAGSVRVAAGAITELATEADDHLRHLQSVEIIRCDIIHSTQALDKPVVILIDDIDRLDPEEVVIMLQTIKGCADFPNISYLLTYDQDHVFKCLSSDTRDAESYIDKIVGIQFEVPEFTPEQREKLLDEILKTGLHQYGEFTPQQQDRFDRLKGLIFLPYFKTLRQFKRFANASFVALAKIAPSRNLPHVDIPDFLVVQFLKMHFPKAYLKLLEADSINTDAHSLLANERQSAFLRVLNDSSVVHGQAADGYSESERCILDHIFRLLRPTSTSENSLNEAGRFHTFYWRRVFTGYSNNRATITPGEWRRLLVAIHKDEGDIVLFETWRETGRLGSCFRTIDARLGEIDEATIPLLMHHLLRWYGRVAFTSPDLSIEELIEFHALFQSFTGNPRWHSAASEITKGTDAHEFATLLAISERLFSAKAPEIPEAENPHISRLLDFLSVNARGRAIERCYALQELKKLAPTSYRKMAAKLLENLALVESYLDDFSKEAIVSNLEMRVIARSVLVKLRAKKNMLPEGLQVRLSRVFEMHLAENQGKIGDHLDTTR